MAKKYVIGYPGPSSWGTWTNITGTRWGPPDSRGGVGSLPGTGQPVRPGEDRIHGAQLDQIVKCHDSFWLWQEPKESMCHVCVSICDFSQIMSTQHSNESWGFYGRQARKQAIKHASTWGHLVGAMPYGGLLSHYLAPGARLGAAGPGGDITTWVKI